MQNKPTTDNQNAADGSLRARIEAIYMNRLPNPETGLYDIKSSIDDLERLFTDTVEQEKIVWERKYLSSQVSTHLFQEEGFAENAAIKRIEELNRIIGGTE